MDQGVQDGGHEVREATAGLHEIRFPLLLRNPDYTGPLALCRIAGDLVAVRIGHNDCAIDVRVDN